MRIRKLFIDSWHTAGNMVRFASETTNESAEVYVADDGTEFTSLIQMLNYNCTYCQF